MVKAEHNTVPNVLGSLCLMCSQAALAADPPPLTLFTWRFPLSPGRWERPPSVPQCSAIWRDEAKPPYMVLQPLYATYTDPSLAFTQALFTQSLRVLGTQKEPEMSHLTKKENHTHWLSLVCRPSLWSRWNSCFIISFLNEPQCYHFDDNNKNNSTNKK